MNTEKNTAVLDSMNDNIIEIKNLQVEYHTMDGVVKAVNGVDLALGRGKTIGLVGLGNTGMATAKIALAFGMKVIAVTSKSNLPEGIRSVSYSELWRQSDIVSLHCPLCDNNRHLINAEVLNQMKPTAILINTGRGPLVDEQALADALNAGKIMASAVDVLSTEPPKADNPLLTAKNCYITPHIAWATIEARQRLMDIAVGNVKAFIDGKPTNVVNG